jgi:Mrp family chromosome partitioning ATPase
MVTPRVMMLTSTSPAEGKSSSALALAQNFSRRGVKVLLIDADLRKPCVPRGERRHRPDQAVDQRR